MKKPSLNSSPDDAARRNAWERNEENLRYMREIAQICADLAETATALQGSADATDALSVTARTTQRAVGLILSEIKGDIRRTMVAQRQLAEAGRERARKRARQFVAEYRAHLAEQARQTQPAAQLVAKPPTPPRWPRDDH